ncbi:glutathione S-transferase II [Apiospora arundinis]
MTDNSSSCPPGTVTNDALNEEMGPFGDAAVRAANGLKDDISASACKELRTIDQVDQDFIQLFRHLSLDAQQSLRNSPARILTVGPQTLGSRGGTGSPSSNGASEQGDDSGSEHSSSNNELDIFPHNPMVFEQALGHAVPVEIPRCD